ncbi:alpha/beta hydrolase [Flavobacterium sp.]
MANDIGKLKDSSQIPKIILYTTKLLGMVSPRLSIRFAAKLFITPIRYKIPKREIYMEQNSIQSKLWIPSINKEIVIYKYGQGKLKGILVHGWSGRGTQLFKIADALVQIGFTTISFDAPAHGKSKGKTSQMAEFVSSIMEIEKQFGPFEFAIGHSLGGMAVLNAINQKFPLKKAVIIGSGDVILDIIEDFVLKLALNKNIAIKLKAYFEEKYGEPMENYSSSFVAKTIIQHILIIHDKNDEEVSVKAAFQINKALKNSELIITEGLGHRKVLGDKNIITQIIEFLK